MNYRLLGLNSISLTEDNAFSESFPLYIASLAQEFKDAYSEGIWSTVKNTGSLAKQGISNIVTVSKATISKLIDAIKLVYKGIAKMIHSAVINFISREKSLAKTIPQLQNILSTLNNIPDDNVKNDTHSYNSVTVADLDKAGWNLANLNEDSSLSTVARFLKLISDRADGESPEDMLSKVNSPDDLYKVLDELLQLAYKRFSENKEMAIYTKWNKLTESISSKINQQGQVHMILKDVDYGKYVAQAFSPAGAFISTKDFDTLKNRGQRMNDIKSVINPRLSVVQGSDSKEEFTRVCNYMITLFNFILSLKISDKFRAKDQKIQKIQSTVNKLMNLTPKDVNRIKDKNQDYNKQNNQNNQSGSESLLPSFILDDLELIQAYGEDDFMNDNTTYNAAFTQAAKDMNDQSNVDNTKTNSNDNNYNDDKTSENKNNELNVNEEDVDAKFVNNGLKYLNTYLTEAGRVIYQEGKFYAMMTKIMYTVSSGFITFMNKTYLPGIQAIKNINPNEGVYNPLNNQDNDKQQNDQSDQNNQPIKNDIDNNE